MKGLLPDSMAGRALLVLLAGLMISHLASTAMYFAEGYEAQTLLSDRQMAERMAIIVRLVEKAPPADRNGAAEALDSPSVRVAWNRSSSIPNGSEERGQLHLMEHILRLQLGNREDDGIRVRFVDDDGDNRSTYFNTAESAGLDEHSDAMLGYMQNVIADTTLVGKVKASVRLPDSSWLNFSAPLFVPRLFSSMRFVLSMSIMLLGVIGLSVWAVRRLVAPLDTFARAAERLGVDMNAPRLPETGPREVRRGARAFNNMQDRIRRFVEDRTRMVAAIAHDLGTPITRLRLRAEYIEDKEQQRKTLADLNEMERMIASTLSFARDDATSEPRQTFDLISLLHNVCDGITDTGQSVEFQSEGRLPYDCRPMALSRAFANLIENAAKYGEKARVSVTDEQGVIRVRIDDNGPGIPEYLHEDVFKPFHRLENSRSKETGGTGLGLTVARTVIHAHGGDITLHNPEEGGLRVEVALPR